VKTDTYRIEIEVQARYLHEQSRPDIDLHAYSYTITITNTGRIGARLTHRHWIIDHGNGHSERVDGEGVVGRQPHLAPGESHTYTSGAMIQTAVGRMQGHYDMLADDGHRFEAEIPSFELNAPRVLH